MSGRDSSTWPTPCTPPSHWGGVFRLITHVSFSQLSSLTIYIRPPQLLGVVLAAPGAPPRPGGVLLSRQCISQIILHHLGLHILPQIRR